MLLTLLLDGVPSSPLDSVPVPIDISEEEDVGTLAQVIAMELSVPIDQQLILHNNVCINRGNSSTLKGLNLADGDVIVVKQNSSALQSVNLLTRCYHSLLKLEAAPRRLLLRSFHSIICRLTCFFR
jgi:hypothetical protein